MNKALHVLYTLIAILSIGQSLHARAEHSIADEAIWLSHLKTGSMPHHWIDLPTADRGKTFSLMDTDLHHLLTALKLKTSVAPDSMRINSMRYMADVSPRQLHVRVLYQF